MVVKKYIINSALEFLKDVLPENFKPMYHSLINSKNTSLNVYKLNLNNCIKVLNDASKNSSDELESEFFKDMALTLKPYAESIEKEIKEDINHYIMDSKVILSVGNNPNKALNFEGSGLISEIDINQQLHLGKITFSVKQLINDELNKIYVNSLVTFNKYSDTLVVEHLSIVTPKLQSNGVVVNFLIPEERLRQIQTDQYLYNAMVFTQGDDAIKIQNFAIKGRYGNTMVNPNITTRLGASSYQKDTVVFFVVYKILDTDINLAVKRDISCTSNFDICVESISGVIFRLNHRSTKEDVVSSANIQVKKDIAQRVDVAWLQKTLSAYNRIGVPT